MRFYLAPMEGITGYIYRRAQHSCFPAFDKYFTPFLSPKQDKTLNAKERRDVLPENNPGMVLVPQILTNRAEDFLRTAEELADYGYREVNLNLGCPSPTVVTKGKGAGALADTDRLKRLLDGIFGKTGLEISIKTRLGMYEEEEWGELLELYCQYPIKELIVHARVREDYYGGSPRLEAFSHALERVGEDCVYNGDIFTEKDMERLKQRFPGLTAVMLGRGALADPGLLGRMKGEAGISIRQLQTFLSALSRDYRAIYSGERDVLFRMKELWAYLEWSFPGAEKQMKAIRKAQRLADYEEAVRRLLYEAGEASVFSAT